MPLITYRDKGFRGPTMAIIEQANIIIGDYLEQGFDLTLRQLYYQFVSRDLLPNTQRSYDKLGVIINDARLAGLIDWNAIVDRTRNLRGLSHWDGPEEIVASAASSFRLDRWATQRNYVEVWFEKDALAGVFAPVCNELDVNYFSCRGYVSQSEMWRAARRLGCKGQDCHIIHLGDHDPSGLDMTRDIKDRLDMFDCGDVAVHRIALTIEQVEQYGPPPNPAKLSDSRAPDYVALYGKESWELDALEPRVLANLVRDKVLTLRDQGRWDERVAEEFEQRKALRAITSNYDAVVGWLTEEGLL